MSHRDSYRRDGYVIVPQAIDPEVIAGVREVISSHVGELASELFAAGRIRSLHEDEPFETRFARICAECGLRARKWHSFLFCRQLHALVTAPGLVGPLAEILGPEVTFHGDYQLTVKLPHGEATAFPWHQDTHYYGVPSRHMHIVTAWVALVDADEENGCLRVLPGSHRWPLLDAARDANLNYRCLEDVEARGNPVTLPARAGDAILLTNMTFHSSGPNRSSGIRWSLDLGYSATPGHCPMDDEERSSYDYLYSGLRAMGRTPLVVHGADPSRAENWEQWFASRVVQLRG